MPKQKLVYLFEYLDVKNTSGLDIVIEELNNYTVFKNRPDAEVEFS
jgi:hypothetical protein